MIISETTRRLTIQEMGYGTPLQPITVEKALQNPTSLYAAAVAVMEDWLQGWRNQDPLLATRRWSADAIKIDTPFTSPKKGLAQVRRYESMIGGPNQCF